MKKIVLGAVFALSFTVGIHAQTIYDGMKIMSNDLTGTARFVGMGGAMGALGGDLSTMGINPAGIGLYRSNDASITLGFSNLTTKSTFENLSMKNDKNRFDAPNVGFVLSMKQGDYTPLRFVNIGFNYKRSRSLSKVMETRGFLGSANLGSGNTMLLTQINQIADQANFMHETGYDLAAISNEDKVNLFGHNSVGWLAALGWKTGLFYRDNKEEMYFPEPNNEADHSFYSKESGGVNQFDFNLSFNINERVYLGATLGFYDVNYKKYSSYDEDYGDQTYYTLNSWNKTVGSAYDLKLGVIVRPFEYSPFRMGFAIHTPTFWDLRLETSANLKGKFYMEDEQQQKYLGDVSMDSYDALGGRDMAIDYYLQTPWKFNWSLGYTVGTQLALGFEYEFAGYTHTKYRYDYDSGGIIPWETSMAKEMLKDVNTIRVGAEYRFVPEFALRAGYTYSTAAFKNNALKYLNYNAVITDTDYANTKEVSNYTFGFGYRGDHFYADLAYKYNTYKEDFYPFDPVENGVAHLLKSNVKNDNHQLLLTLGYRF